MQGHDELERQIEALRERMSKLCTAIACIHPSLDLDIVLHKRSSTAPRALNGALHGVFTTVDEAGHPQQFLSSGITPEGHRQLLEWVD